MPPGKFNFLKLELLKNALDTLRQLKYLMDPRPWKTVGSLIFGSAHADKFGEVNL